jgi:hypothetical protein
VPPRRVITLIAPLFSSMASLTVLDVRAAGPTQRRVQLVVREPGAGHHVLGELAVVDQDLRAPLDQLLALRLWKVSVPTA